MGFSKDWTDEERLKIVVVLASMIQDDIPAGRYGAPLEPQVDDGVPVKFRPNMQSIIEIIAMPASALEAQRADIEAFITEQLAVIGESPDEFFNTTLAEQRARIEAVGG